MVATNARGSSDAGASVLSVSLPTRSGWAGSEMVRFAQAAEEARFTGLFVAERVADAFVLCQQILDATSSLTVGTAVLNARLRHPVLCAMSAMALTESSGGRFVLGLGTANAALNEGRLGMGGIAPRSWMAEYVAVVRLACGGRPIQYSGSFFEVDELELDRELAVRVPLHLGALQRGMLRLAATSADGVILNLCSLAGLSTSLAHLTAAGVERDPVLGPLQISCVVPCCVSEDVDLAREVARHTVLDYVLHPAAAELFGADSEPGYVEALQREMSRGERARAAGLLSDEFVDRFVVSGPPQACAERVRRYRDAGVDTPVVFPRPVGPGWVDAVWELADAYRDRDLVMAGTVRPGAGESCT